MLQAQQYQPNFDLEKNHAALSATLRLATLRTQSVDYLEQKRFTGDFYGLLNALNINPLYWPLCLLANHYKHPGQYRGEPSIQIAETQQVLRYNTPTVISS